MDRLKLAMSSPCHAKNSHIACKNRDRDFGYGYGCKYTHWTLISLINTQLTHQSRNDNFVLFVKWMDFLSMPFGHEFGQPGVEHRDWAKTILIFIILITGVFLLLVKSDERLGPVRHSSPNWSDWWFAGPYFRYVPSPCAWGGYFWCRWRLH
jgi:hypothetical protein